MAVLTFWLTMAFTLLVLSAGRPEMRMFVTTRAAIVAASTRTASRPSRNCGRPNPRLRPGSGSGGTGGGDSAAPAGSAAESSVVESRAVRPRPSIIAPTVPRPFDSRLFALASGRFGPDRSTAKAFCAVRGGLL